MSGKYDKIIKEGLKASIAGLLRRVIGLEYEKLETFIPKLQYTLEREADFFARITDKTGRSFIVHLEFQSANESGMAWRMYQYRGLISQKYALPVRQYVIFLGSEPSEMSTTIEEEDLSFCFRLIELRQIPYQVFLQSGHLSEAVLAILGNLQNQPTEQAVEDIVKSVVQLKPEGLEREQAIRQLEALAQLRGLQSIVSEKITKMALDFFDIKKDPRYQEGKLEGEQKGELKAKAAAVQRALAKGKLTAEEIAELMDVSVEFVEEVRRKMRP